MADASYGYPGELEPQGEGQACDQSCPGRSPKKRKAKVGHISSPVSDVTDKEDWLGFAKGLFLSLSVLSF